MKQKVTVIGIGRLGLAFALLLDSKGFDVCGCDVNEKYVASLKDKTFRSDEPQINELLDSCNIKFTTNCSEAFWFAPVIFLFVPTPSKETGEYDHSYIEQVIEKFEQEKIQFKTLIIGCTVMPGYCAALEKRLARLGTHIVYNPEFIQQGNILDGLKNADIVLIGGKIPMVLFDLYVSIMNRYPVFKYLSHTGAEIAKIAINCFLATKIAYANMIGEIIINSGEKSVSDILDAVGSDSRIGNKFLRYGFSYGGVCIPRDGKALNCHAEKVGITTSLPADVDRENKRHAEYLKEYWMNENPDKDVPFSFSYLGYKKGVNILTESYQYKLCMDLLEEGYSVVLSDSIMLNGIAQDFKDYFDAGKISFEPSRSAIKVN